MDKHMACECAYKNGFEAGMKEANTKRDEIIIGLMSLVESLLYCGVGLPEEEEKYDLLVGEYERLCAKEEG